MLKLGDNIKKLRSERDLTQEQLADALGVSPQAVSRWENSTTYPDIELLPVIAGFFEITLDELMGMADFQDERQLQQIYDLHYANSSKGLVWEDIEMIRRELKHFPNNERLRFYLMHDLNRAWNNPRGPQGEVLPAEYREAFLPEAISLGEKLLAHCTDSYIRNSTTSLLATMYHETGDTEKAIQYAEKLPNLWNCRTTQMHRFYEGEERKKCLQEALDDFATAMLVNLEYLADLNCKDQGLTNPQRIEIIQKGIHIFETLFDRGDYLFHNCDIARHHRYIAALAMLDKDCGLALDHLEKAAECAVAFDTLPVTAKHTSLLFDSVEFNMLHTSKNYTHTSCHELLDKMNGGRYDAIRQEERFRAVLEKIKPYASSGHITAAH